MKSKDLLLLSVGFAMVLASANAPQCSLAQGEQQADQAAFQDDEELMRMNNAQIHELEGEEQNADQQASFDDKRNQAYRLYAEKRVEDLEKLKGGNPQNDKQIAVLQRWLKADAATRLRDQQTINALRKRVANMEQTQQAETSNLGNDVGALREAATDARSNQQFKQQMSINYFNEMQSEMGPAHMIKANSGPSYNMGGMGFNGGQQLFGGGY